MAEFDNSVTVNVTGMEEPVREIKAAVNSVAGTIKTNRLISLYITLLTLINVAVVGYTSLVAENAVYILAFVVGALILLLLFSRRRPINVKE